MAYPQDYGEINAPDRYPQTQEKMPEASLRERVAALESMLANLRGDTDKDRDRLHALEQRVG